MLDLGRGLGGPDWELAVEKAAEFLYVSAVHTGARDARRLAEAATGHPEKEGDAPLSLVVLRHAGVRGRHDAAGFGVCPPHVRRRRPPLAGRSAHGARGQKGPAGPTALMTVFAARPSSQSAKVEATVKQKLVECNLVVEHFLQEATEVVKLEAGCDAKEYVAPPG